MMSLYSVFLLPSKAWEGTGFFERDFYPAIHDDLARCQPSGFKLHSIDGHLLLLAGVKWQHCHGAGCLWYFMATFFQLLKKKKKKKSKLQATKF